MITLTCLYGLLAGIIILAVMLIGGDILFALILSIFAIIFQFLISPWITDITMKWFYKAKMGAGVPEYLSSFIASECQKYNVKYPKIGIIDDGAPNAFTYGRTKKDARIIMTRGLFELLTDEEVKAVVGHEMGHIVHMDMLFMTAAQVIPLIMYAIYESFTKRSNNNSKDSGKGAIVGLIAYVLYIITQYIVLWLSRTREYYADEFSVLETGNPNALAEALVKVGFGLSVNNAGNKHNVSKNNALGIFDSRTSKALTISALDSNGVSKDRIKSAMKWEMWNPWAKWFELNSTHPLISKRLIAISRYSQQFNQQPYIIFDLPKEKGYMGNFGLELILTIIPYVIVVPALICFALFVGEYTKVGLLYIEGAVIISLLCAFIKFRMAHKKNYSPKKVADLLGEVNVSHITSVPCVLNGKIIGRGNPGCIFSEDFVVQDDTGIIFLDYNQPLTILNKIFALFKSPQYFDKIIEVKGWYRRSPVPYVEIYEYSIDGRKKKIYTYPLALSLYIISMVIAIIVFVATLGA